eukprot:422380_1
MASKVTTPFSNRLKLNKNESVSSISTSMDYEDFIPAPNLRVNGITIFRPIIYGNISYRLRRPPSKNTTISSRMLQEDNQDWFRWTIYVRGVENEDLSYFIKKVIFYLHDSYTEPIRVIENAPFELTEEGWGQFDIKIEIFFHDIPGLQTNLKQQTNLNNNKQKDYKNGYENYNNNNNNFNNRINNGHININIINGYKNNSFNINDNIMKTMISDKECEISELISQCYDASNDNKIMVIHPLKLFGDNANEDSKKGIIDETFSEIEFTDPYYSLYEKLMLGPYKLIQNHPFFDHWQNKMVYIAEKEQLLIDKISITHRNLLKKIEMAKKEYKMLLNQNKNVQNNNNKTNKIINKINNVNTKSNHTNSYINNN